MSDVDVSDGRLTLGLAALRLGVQPHHLQRLATRGQIPHERIGRIRVVKLSDFDVIRMACQRSGYLREGTH